MQKLVSLLGIAAALAGCAPAPTAPETPHPTVNATPASIQLTGGSRADQRLDVVATVLTQAGAPVPGVVVAFTVTSGTVTNAEVTTDTDGVARTIASAAWQNTITATGAGLSQSWKIAGAPAPSASSISLSVLSDSTIYAGVSTTFGVSVSGGVSPLRITDWDFGDGEHAATSIAPSHTYGSQRSYTVTVTVADAAGSTATASRGITVRAAPTTPTPAPLTISVSIICTAVTPLRQSCTATPMYGGSALTSLVSSMTVDWTSNGTTVAMTPAVATAHDFAAAGTYTIKVAGTLSTGETFSGTKSVTVG